MTDYATYASASAHKLLADNRDIYILQSALGCDFAEAARRYAAEQEPGDDYETELAEGFAMKYGVAHDAG